MNSMASNHEQEATSIVHNHRVRARPSPKVFSSPSSLSAASSSLPRKQFSSRLHECRFTKFLIQNHSNFKRSGPPGRFMYFEDGSWVDYSEQVLDLLKSGFVEGKPVVEVQTDDSLWLFDFYRMLVLDLETGNQRSIAWIDVDGKCFFPRTFVGGGGEPETEVAYVPENPEIEIENVAENLSSDNPKIEIDIRIGENPNLNSGNRKRKRECMEFESEGVEAGRTEGSSSNDQRDGVKRRQVVEPDVQSPRWPKAKLLKEAEKAYSIVRNLFLSGLGIVEPGATITAIYQCLRTGPLDRARHEVFQEQIETTKAARGEPNVTFAWHGTSSKGVASILSHGFGMPTKIPGTEAHGVGIYLSPIRSPHTSAMLSEVDDNGEKHVILCRVIVGKCEKVEAGSQQLYPSSADFDTGVDDLQNPTWYVVWCAMMNTHILPECVLSYKSPCSVPGQLSGSSFMKWVPNASNTLVAKLFSKLGSFLPPAKVGELKSLCSTYKDGKLAKDIFMKQLRSVVGDKLLLSTIREIRG